MVAINELLCMENAGAEITNKGLGPIAIEKIKIPGAVLEHPSKQHC